MSNALLCFEITALSLEQVLQLTAYIVVIIMTVADRTACKTYHIPGEYKKRSLLVCECQSNETQQFDTPHRKRLVHNLLARDRIVYVGSQYHLRTDYNADLPSYTLDYSMSQRAYLHHSASLRWMRD